ncbi:MAG: ABC transporter ATP-binding protein, partial [Roseibium sp.]
MHEPDPKPRKWAKFFSEEELEAIGWFWRNYLKSKTPWLLLVFGIIAIQGLVYQQFLRLTEDGLRVVFENGSAKELAGVCATVFGVFLVRAVTSYAGPRISVWVASNAVEEMRTDMIAHYLTLDLAYFERTSPGNVILRLVQQSQALSGFVGQQTVNALRDILTVLILSTYLIYKEPILFSATAIVIPVIILLIRRISAKIKSIQRTSENALGAYMDGVEEMVNGMRTVKISGQEPVEETRLGESTHNIRNLQIKLQAAKALMSPFVDVAAGIAYVMVIGGGGYMVLSPDYDIDGAGIITFLLGLVLVFDPGRRFSTYLVSLQASMVQLRSIRSVFRLVASIVEKPGALDHFDRLGDIELRDLTFRYSDDQPLFEGLNLTLRGGKVNAIVGPTGSGKTTILSLLGRLYDPVSGSITIGGTTVSDIKIGV